MAWTHLGLEDAAAARRCFFESVRAYTELASIRGVGLSLIGLAAAAAVDHRPDAAVRIAAAAEIYASEEGIVNVYGDNPVGRTPGGPNFAPRSTLRLPPPPRLVGGCLGS
jgi:hypothetical protein